MIDYPLYQVFATYFLCFFNTLYVIAVKPFKSPTSNFSEIFNEICLLFGATHLFLYTDYMQGQVSIQYSSGWSMIALTALNVIVNVSLMVVASVRMVKMLFLKIRWKYRNW